MRKEVEKRARHQCEYCQAPQNICAYTFHIEHILPRSKGGLDKLSNYALACFYCNNSKGAHTTGHDPETGEDVPLFHPRKDKWEEHFKWSKGFLTIYGVTPRGRATVERLRMNIQARKEGRELWRMTDQWP